MSRVSALLRRVSTPVMVLASFLAMVIGAGAILQLASSPSYTVTARLSATPRSANAPSASIIRLLAGTYVAYGSSDAFAERVSQAIGVPIGRVSEAISLDISSIGATIGITVTSSPGAQSSAIADEVVRLMVARAASDEVLRITVADVSEASEADVSKRLRMTAAVLLVVALVTLIGVAAEAVRRLRGRWARGTVD